MYRVTKSISFCYGHRLLNHQGPCRHLHGHNARAVVTLEGEHLDDQGMICDFSEIKQMVKAWVDTEFDHTMLLHRDDPVLPLLQEAGERVRVVDWNPTAENIARAIFDHIAAAGYPVVEVILWETESSHAAYRPD
ncbi:MAG: 6-carboxytetrahydropterin synthase QueD [Gammaproteobacteria bacterium]|nr:6-carboxytetrahydropterin synthase QueD [Gammaproteobacteria bacterium]